MLKFDFEIKVALLGHVSVGKTTILNALFREKFSEVSMKRTTAGINHFRVTTKRNASKTKVDGRKSNGEEFVNVDGDDESTDSSSNHMSAKATLAEIMADNANLRNSNHIEEKFFDIELDHPIISNMRDDTCMVIVDIPGVNEAGTQKMYLDYVEKSWDTFDIIIVVMDAQQGVNTDEQVSLLNFVNNNNDFRKDIPVIVLCNKVDDPEDKELAALVEEAQREVERIFSVGDRKKALSALFENKLDQDSLEEGTPAFLHISAENAFLYRATSRLEVKGLKKLNKSYIDKIGRQEVGKFKWKKLSENEQYELVHDILSDPDLYEERLESSNFDKLLYLLDLFVGGKDQQEKIIDKQLEVSLRKLSVENGIVDQLHNIFVRSHALGRDTLPIEDRFWELWEKQCENALKEFDKSPSNLSSLQVPMKELISFERCLHKKLHNVPRNGTKITTAMQGLIEKHINIILQKADKWDPTLIEEELDGIGQFNPHGKSCGSGSDLHFGNAAKASPNPFGKAPMPSDYPFDASAKFGQAAPAPSPAPFGATTGSTPFGQSSIQSNSTPFGGSKANAAPFGQSSNTTAPSPFGTSTQSSNVPAPSPFGTSTQPTNAPTPSPFGTSAQPSNAPTPSSFGTSAPSSFGAPTPGATPFGAAASSPFGSGISPSSKTFAGKTPKEMLLAFYQQYNASKLHTVDQVLQKYQGNEEQLFRNLAKKYNLDPTVFGLSSPTPGFGGGVGFGSPSQLGGGGGFGASSPVPAPSFGTTLAASSPASSFGAKSSGFGGGGTASGGFGSLAQQGGSFGSSNTGSFGGPTPFGSASGTPNAGFGGSPFGGPRR